MRKKALKKLYPNRGFLLKQNRDNFSLKEFVHNNGAVTYLNFVKHFLFNIPYKNEEYKKDFARYTNEMYKRVNKRMEGNKNGWWRY